MPVKFISLDQISLNVIISTLLTQQNNMSIFTCNQMNELITLLLSHFDNNNNKSIGLK